MPKSNFISYAPFVTLNISFLYKRMASTYAHNVVRRVGGYITSGDLIDRLQTGRQCRLRRHIATGYTKATLYYSYYVLNEVNEFTRQPKEI